MHACKTKKQKKDHASMQNQDIEKKKNAYLSYFVNDLGWVAGAKRVDQFPKYDRHERLR